MIDLSQIATDPEAAQTFLNQCDWIESCFDTEAGRLVLGLLDELGGKDEIHVYGNMNTEEALLRIGRQQVPAYIRFMLKGRELMAKTMEKIEELEGKIADERLD